MCIGSLKLDIEAQIGYNLHSLKLNEKFYLENGAFVHGGSAANIAVGLSLLNLKVGLVSTASNDAIGNFLVKEIRDKKVKVLFKQQSGTSPFSVVIHGKGGRIVLSHDKLGERLRVPANTLNNYQSHFLVATGIQTPSLPILLNTLNIFKTDYCVLIPRIEQCQEKPIIFRKILRQIDLLHLNQTEARYLINKKKMITKSDLTAIGTLGPKRVIVTLGTKGVFYWEKGNTVFMPIIPITKVVDEFGAGDTFLVGFIYGLKNKRSVRDSLKIASYAAAYCVTQYGARQGMPKLRDLRKFIQSYEDSANIK